MRQWGPCEALGDPGSKSDSPPPQKGGCRRLVDPLFRQSATAGNRFWHILALPVLKLAWRLVHAILASSWCAWEENTRAAACHAGLCSLHSFHWVPVCISPARSSWDYGWSHAALPNAFGSTGPPLPSIAWSHPAIVTPPRAPVRLLMRALMWRLCCRVDVRQADRLLFLREGCAASMVWHTRQLPHAYVLHASC